MGTSRDDKVDAVRLPNVFDQEDLELCGLHEGEHDLTEEWHYL